MRSFLDAYTHTYTTRTGNLDCCNGAFRNTESFEMDGRKRVLVVAGIWCGVLTFAHFHSISVYQLSRWAVCAAAIFGFLNTQSPWKWAMVAVAVLFNPLGPIHFSRESWPVLDGMAAFAFIWVALKSR
ncbi:MAG: DUF6804 family protein [Luteolibacter sp.]